MNSPPGLVFLFILNTYTDSSIFKTIMILPRLLKKETISYTDNKLQYLHYNYDTYCYAKI